MTIRSFIIPLGVAAGAFCVVDAQAQGAFPAPLPGAAAAQPAAASPFPPVNSAPATPANASPAPSPFPPVNGAAATPSAFPSGGAAPVGGFGGAAAGPPQGGGADCMKEFQPLRDETERRGKLIKVASDRRAAPAEACKLIGNFAQAQLKMAKFVETKQRVCGIPAEITKQMRDGVKNTEQIQKRVCGTAAQAQQQPAGPPAPSLSEALGTSTALPEARPAKRSGGSTFDTLSGNVLAR